MTAPQDTTIPDERLRVLNEHFGFKASFNHNQWEFRDMSGRGISPLEVASLVSEVIATRARRTEQQAVSGVKEDRWLVTAGPDGAHSTIVSGLDALKREVVGSVFSDPEDASDEANDMRARLDDEDQWNVSQNGPRWSIDWEFEDGYVHVQRITSALNLSPSPQVEGLVKALTNIHTKLCEARTVPGYEATSIYSWCVDECRAALAATNTAGVR